ncbi:MAG: hypothetical protein ACRDQ5_01820 [Sciscionella sp.]
MDYHIWASERATFKRCRRQWDLGSPNRRDLEPVDASPTDPLPDAIKDALAVYYYPGMWDWQSTIVLPLVYKALRRSLSDVGREDLIGVAEEVLEQYVVHASKVDDFSPIKIDHDVYGILPDPNDPSSGLVTADGQRVLYADRVDLLAVDSNDNYWVILHQLVDKWQDLDAMLLDEDAVAACWTWEQSYVGVHLTGTIHNEVRPVPVPAGRRRNVELPLRRGLAQNEPSGGGRSIGQHRRLFGRQLESATTDRVEQQETGIVRRTKISRTREEIEGMGRQIGLEALEMVDSRLALYPNPTRANCTQCPFVAPCLTMKEGADVAELLASGYRQRPQEQAVQPRLGAVTWGTNRGAAPPRFG